MRSLTILFVVALTIPLAASQACSPYSPDLGTAPFLCGDTDPKCPDGYTCMTSGSADVCVGSDGTLPDGGHGSCADDSALEPNDTLQTAWVSPVADTKSMLVLAGLAICPAGDKDTYNVHLGTVMNLEATVVYDASGAPLQVVILGGTGSGTILGTSSPVSGMQDTVHAYVANLPSGTYYAQVTGPTSGTLQTNQLQADAQRDALTALQAATARA